MIPSVHMWVVFGRDGMCVYVCVKEVLHVFVWRVVSMHMCLCGIQFVYEFECHRCHSLLFSHLVAPVPVRIIIIIF